MGIATGYTQHEVLALEEYIRRHHNHRLLEQINAGHDDEPDADERACLQMMRRRHRQIVEGGW